jgi:hypothetical protein
LAAGEVEPVAGAVEVFDGFAEQSRGAGEAEDLGGDPAAGLAEGDRDAAKREQALGSLLIERHR